MRTMILAFTAAALAGGASAQNLDPNAVLRREKDPSYQQFERQVKANLEARMAELIQLMRGTN